LRLELRGPSPAFWRYRKHGYDLFGYGITIEWDWWRVGLGLTLVDYDADPHWHFTSFTLIGIRVPFLYFDISIWDRRN
jgi:hypothetical protein